MAFKDTDETVFVERKAGVIVGVYRRKQPGYAEEELLATHADVTAFKERISTPQGAPA